MRPQNGSVHADPELLSELLRAWGFAGDANLARADQGTNNQTFAVSRGGRRCVLRISENLSVAQARAEHRLLRRLRRADLPFEVPEPVPAPDGRTVIETPAGPATLCRWLPGVHPDLGTEPALEHFGRAVGLLGEALRAVPPQDAPQDWRSDSRPPLLDQADREDLGRDLRAAGVSGEQAALLAATTRRVERWWPPAGGALPVQVVHGDQAASNALVRPDTGQVSALLDFEIAGADFRVQDFVAALFNSGALRSPHWRRRTAAFARGHASARALSVAEIEELPELLVFRSLGSALWRAGRWRRGQAPAGEVINCLQRLETTTRWVAANGPELRAIVAAAG
jgi:homoserine kinase type II